VFRSAQHFDQLKCNHSVGSAAGRIFDSANRHDACDLPALCFAHIRVLFGDQCERAFFGSLSKSLSFDCFLLHESGTAGHLRQELEPNRHGYLTDRRGIPVAKDKAARTTSCAAEKLLEERTNLTKKVHAKVKMTRAADPKGRQPSCRRA